MKLLFLSFVLLSSVFSNGFWNEKVHSFGNLPEVLKYQDKADTISLQNLKSKAHIYGVGILDQLQGEILIIDSKPLISKLHQNGSATIEKSFAHNASFLVYAEVPRWIEDKIPSTIYNKQQFVEYLEEMAKENGISTFKPFPFIIEGKIKANRYRIFSHRESDTISGYDGTCACDLREEQTKRTKYKTKTIYDTVLSTPLKIIGFYSPKRGIITDEYSYTYMNFLSERKKLVGNVQKMMIGENMVLKLPKIE